MSVVTIERGDGVGIEFTDDLLRGVRLANDLPGVAAAAEVSLPRTADDHATLDAFVRLRAELGNPNLPTRIAAFPAGSSMRRIDVTSRTGPELNALRADVEQRFGATSTVLVDRGPRRWMHVLQWDSSRLRHLEDLAERSGFLDVTFEPSPIALVRVCDASTTFVERCAATGEAFVVAVDDGTPVAAASIEAVGRTHPDLAVGRTEYSVALFDDLSDPAEIFERLAIVDGRQFDELDGYGIHIAGEPYDLYPPHDLRAPERQCVALGAAVGAAGLAGRLRPIDIVAVNASAFSDLARPWAIERVSELPPVTPTAPPGRLRRAAARLKRSGS